MFQLLYHTDRRLSSLFESLPLPPQFGHHCEWCEIHLYDSYNTLTLQFLYLLISVDFCLYSSPVSYSHDYIHLKKSIPEIISSNDLTITSVLPFFSFIVIVLTLWWDLCLFHSSILSVFIQTSSLLFLLYLVRVHKPALLLNPRGILNHLSACSLNHCLAKFKSWINLANCFFLLNVINSWN